MVNVRQKGKRGELEVVKILNKKFNTGVRRTPNSGGLSIKGDIIDIDPRSILSEFHFEIKNCKRIVMPKWKDQAEGDCPRCKTPLVVYKRKGWQVDLPLEDFLNVLKELEDLRNG